MPDGDPVVVQKNVGPRLRLGYETERVVTGPEGREREGRRERGEGGREGGREGERERGEGREEIGREEGERERGRESKQ